MDRAVTTMETFSPVSLRGSVFPFVVSCGRSLSHPDVSLPLHQHPLAFLVLAFYYHTIDAREKVYAKGIVRGHLAASMRASIVPIGRSCQV